MIRNKLALVDEQTSPLFRIMWVHNSTIPRRRVFENNICAFHIGNGYLLTVAHNLRTEASVMRSMETSQYRQLISHLPPEHRPAFEKHYTAENGKHYLNPAITPPELRMMADRFTALPVDRRWITLMQQGYARPAVIIQFRNRDFYNDPALTKLIPASSYMHEPFINRHTYLLNVELVTAWYPDDIALYRITDVEDTLVDALPVIELDFAVVEDTGRQLFCLQSAPQNELGRLLNEAYIAGYLDNFSMIQDRFGGNLILDGRRYMIRGYFRFGSSGAPYLYFNDASGTFRVVAIQSEACPIQLAIGNNREGNFQYVNAIATPLSNIEKELKALIMN